MQRANSAAYSFPLRPPLLREITMATHDAAQEEKGKVRGREGRSKRSRCEEGGIATGQGWKSGRVVGGIGWLEKKGGGNVESGGDEGGGGEAMAGVGCLYDDMLLCSALLRKTP
ncbi:hypothetical protein KM043_015564 [Ampulex compressa]|nr:hypothetical protein KM043_015564 [Ampulex compressa]